MQTCRDLRPQMIYSYLLFVAFHKFWPKLHPTRGLNSMLVRLSSDIVSTVDREVTIVVCLVYWTSK